MNIEDYAKEFYKQIKKSRNTKNNYNNMYLFACI